MDRRTVIRTVLEGGRPPYVPWQIGFSSGAREKLAAVYGAGDPEAHVGNHMLMLRRLEATFNDLGGGFVRDAFGVVWDRRHDADIGVPSGDVLPRPTLAGLSLPDPADPRFFIGFEQRVSEGGDRFRVFAAACSLYERAWSMRGMEALLMDFLEQPGFVAELLDLLTDWEIAQLDEALRYDIDAVWFGDDWGQQQGLQMGRPLWDEFIYPRIARMYAAAREAGLFVMNHSCGDVDELFDDLIAIGLDCTNPVQPEVMDVDALVPRYRGRLAFYGGLSTQRTLPFGSVDEVRTASEHLLQLGAAGSYVLAPSNVVAGDVPLENILAMVEVVQAQVGTKDAWSQRDPSV
jgi:uroporphyrinogen decarboxylase